MCLKYWVLLLCSASVSSLSGQEPADSGAPSIAMEELDFDRDVRPILADKCFSCHGPDAEAIAADLRLDEAALALISPENPGGAIRAGEPDKSPLVERIEASDPAERMPPPESHKELSASEISILRRWIREGAIYRAPWAFTAPEPRALPSLDDDRWSKGPIDRHVLAAMRKRGLSPSSPADRATWLRRVSLDLLGLPPSPEELDAFAADGRPDAAERQVDRLLASPRYGERMAMQWLDLARYGDTNGYHADSDRPVWVWRDWVIDAYNANMPFDQFTIEQLAGDLLPDATTEQKIASGFNRNVRFNEEGGADPAEFLTAYAADRVITLGRVWLGLTLDCAQCHSHKYDPISQHEFYSLTAFFNSLEEVGAGGVSGFHGQPVPPVMRVLPERMRWEIDAAQQRLAAAETAIDQAVATYAYVDPISEDESVDWQAEGIVEASQRAWEQAVLEQRVPVAPEPIAAWDFASGAEDRFGKLNIELRNGARLEDQGLVLDGTSGFAVTPALDRELRSRTLEASVRLSTLEQAGGAVIALQTLQENPEVMRFDAIVFGERQPKHWMAGSDFFNRTEDFGGEPESEAADRFVTIAMVYDEDGTIRAYRDGLPYGRAYRKSDLQVYAAGEARVVLGARALPPQGNFMLAGTIQQARLYDRALTEEEVAAAAGVARYRVPAELEESLSKAPAERSEEERQAIRNYYLREVHAGAKQALQPLRERQEMLRGVWERLRDEANHPLQMVSVELPEPRPAHLLIRGDFQNPGEQVSRTVPAFLPPFEPGEKPNRLTLARWLMQPDQPLVARVQVNRLWQMAFGEGLVRSMGDFGRQGTYPTHPELLDALALRFQESGWDVKDSLRRIMVSQTYGQSSEDWRRHADVDPQNLWLWRAPRVRLSAESIRDNALAIAGSLSQRVGGPPVFPYQPDDYYRDKNGGWRWNVSGGDDLYRRGLYTFWRRTTPYPSFVIFDAPDRAECTVSRPRTNTPLQALVTLNDPQFVEAARLFAERLLREGGAEDGERLVTAFRISLSRSPSEDERVTLLEALAAERTILRENPQQAELIATLGRAPRAPGLEGAEVAAWTAVASMILNLDETLNRE